MAIAPPQAGEDPHLFGDLLLEIQAKAVAVASLTPGGDDVGTGRLAIEEIGDRLGIISHVRLIHVAQQTHRALPMRD